MFKFIKDIREAMQCNLEIASINRHEGLAEKKEEKILQLKEEIVVHREKAAAMVKTISDDQKVKLEEKREKREEKRVARVNKREEKRLKAQLKAKVKVQKQLNAKAQS